MKVRKKYKIKGQKMKRKKYICTYQNLKLTDVKVNVAKMSSTILHTGL